MSEIKESEQIFRELRVLVDAYAEAKKINVVRPIPIVRDRQGRLAKDLTLKDWFCKLNEELDELKNELLGVYVLYNGHCSEANRPSYEERKRIVGELCDVIEVLYSMANQMGIDGDMIQQGIHETNEKLKERGCI